MVAKCQKCKGPVAYVRSYSGDRLCIECFRSSILDKTRKTVSKYKMLSYGDRVAVAISGGKDSLSLLEILNTISVTHGCKLYPFIVDEGIAGYREEALQITQEYVSSLNLNLEILSFKELFSQTLDDALSSRGGNKVSSCSICGVLRRRAMDMAAKKIGANAIATGHNLDDILQTFMINQLSGDVERISRVHPGHAGNKSYGLRRIKPFAEIYESEIAYYAFIRGLPFQGTKCPHGEEGIRSEIRGFLNGLEVRHPGMKYSLLKTALRMAENLDITERGIQNCQICGTPSSNSICSVCKTMTQLSGRVDPPLSGSVYQGH